MNFKIRQVDIHGSDLYLIESTAPKGKYRLFLEWDDENDYKNAIKALEALQVEGILIKSQRGHHFIASMKPLDEERIIALQKIFKVDPMWIKHAWSSNPWNGKRGSCLRVSMKYENEKPLKVIVHYPFTDERLKEKYEAIVKKYFYKGDPYWIDSDGVNPYWTGDDDPDNDNIDEPF